MSKSPPPELVNGATPFSKRLAEFDNRLSYDTSNYSLAVKDQLLISATFSPDAISGFKQNNIAGPIGDYLEKREVKRRLLTTVFHGLPNPGNFEDVAIYEVTLPSNLTVFELAQGIRADVLPSNQPDKASPNHVMIPAANELWCPAGPPAPLTSIPAHNPLGSHGVPITVIDSGYVWCPPSPGTPWGPTGSAAENPLRDLTMSYHVHEAQWLHVNGAPPGWENGTPNILDADSDQTLDALAGHANFVAGVIAQHCELPNIHIWNHNSGFSPTTPSDHFATEAAICRSLVMSQQKKQTPVIQIGHASPFLGDRASAAWALAFKRIGWKRKLNEDLVLTCPAGNQGLIPDLATIPRFPAALHSHYPFVKGVASVNKARQRSAWSNYGEWVTCSAIGEHVRSAFLYVNMPLEDEKPPSGALPPSRDFTSNSWATWNGTSFAAPKVAGEVAARIASNVNAHHAWNTLITCLDCGPLPGLGRVFHF